VGRRRDRRVSAGAVCGLVVIALTVGGCAIVGTADRGLLADPLMALPGEEPLQESLEAHWMEAREGAAGGWGPATAGCGCN